ncbi:unnamed protein product [Blepharisma stoltei]|uniref:Cytochrome b5 heme-binding domain-containing protein n=1 Tax=Blepharisma stoltei TaxID=1481888 RepID=A0AAU9JZC8_9CILI|nr:unnamed protein product [Blepharisma stoltei]
MVKFTFFILYISLAFSLADLVTVELNENFHLSWIMNQTAITFTFNCSFDGWCGIGFNSGMINTDMIILIRENGLMQAWDSYSFKPQTPAQDSAISGCKNDIILESASFTGGIMLATITRLLNTQDPKCDIVLAPNMVTNFCFAYLDKPNLTKFTQHNMVGSGVLKLGTTQANAYFNNPPDIISVELDPNFLLSWVVEDEVNLVFTFNCSFDGWCGIGFNEAMTDTDMIILIRENSELMVWDAYSTTFQQPQLDTGIQGCQNNIIVKSTSFDNGQISATFSRLMDTGDNECDKVLVPDVPMKFCFAYLDEPNLTSFTKHSSVGSGILKIGTTQDSSYFMLNPELVTMQLDPNFSLSWLMNETDITFTFNCTFDGWCGIGFNQAMINTDMIIVTRINGTIQALDAYSIDYVPPNGDATIPGCENNIVLESSSFVDGKMLVTVTRPLNTGDTKCDKVLNPNMVTSFCYAYLDQPNLQAFNRHNHVGSGILKLGSTQGTSSYTQGGAETVSVELDPNFSLSWVMTETQVTFTFNCKFDGWCAIGFGHAMEDTDMIIVIRENGAFQAWDSYSSGYTTPSQDSSLKGCKNNANMINAEFTANKTMVVTVTRLLNTGDSKCDVVLKPNMITEFCFAYNSESDLTTFPIHNAVGMGKIKLGMTQADSYFHHGDDIDGALYENHGIYMTVMWLCVVQVGIMAIRYFKWSFMAYLIHALSGAVVIFFTLASVYIVYKKDKLGYDALSDKPRYHSRIGFYLCTLVLSQAVTGLFTKIWMMFKQDLSVLRVSRRIHTVIGWACLIPALVNLKYGWEIRQNDTNLHTVYVFYGVLCVVFAVLEIRHRFGHLFMPFIFNFKRKKINRKSTITADKEMQDTFIDKKGLNHSEILDEINIKKSQWVFLDEYVLDISGFMQNHPGGAYMLKDVIGEDVGKYINGCSSIGDGTFPYEHSQMAKNLAYSLVVGNIAKNCNIIKPIEGDTIDWSMTWEIVRKHNISQSTVCVELRSNAYEVREKPKGLEWMGKHFQVEAKIGLNVVRRYYSLVSANLYSWKKQIEAEGIKCEFNAAQYNESSTIGSLKLYIKHYPDGKMSDFIYNLDSNSTIKIKGPLGPGLALTQLSSGLYLGFAAGTGILPFLDLAYSIWNDHAPTGFCLFLYVSFRSKSEAFGLDLLEATQKKFSTHLVVHINIDGERIGGKINDDMLRSQVGSRGVSRVWVCGPSGFNRWIGKMVETQGISREKVMIL